MSQLILSEVEHRYPEGVLVAIEEEPRILNGIVVAHDMQFSGRRIALGAHNGDLITFPCHINHYQRMPHALQLAGRIDKHITGCTSLIFRGSVSRLTENVLHTP